MGKLILSFFIYILLCNNTHIYSTSYEMHLYEKAKELYNSKDYDQTIEHINQISHQLKNTDLMPYALFYKAMASYRLNKLDQSLKIFLQIKDQYPNWQQIDECMYWLSYISFINQDINQAKAHINNIKSKKLKVHVYKLKEKILNKEKELTSLELSHSDNTEKPISDYEIKRKKYLANLKSQFKKKYNVAVLLPLCINNNQCTNDITDLYTGIKTAEETLNLAGIQINLSIYDTEKNPEKTSLILDNIKDTDFILGPLYQAEIEEVKKFVEKNKINVLNPLSTNKEVFQNNDFIFLLQPSIETQAMSAGEYVKNNLLENSKNNIGIIYSESPEDLLMANTYKEYLENNAGFTVSLMESISSERAKKILFEFKTNMKLKKKGRKYDEFYDKINELTHLFIASKKNELIINNMLALADLLTNKPQILGHFSWLNFTSLDYEQLKRLNTILISPEYIDNKKESVKNFKINYIAKFNCTPSYYACIGYEAMMFIGVMLNEGGSYFQKNISCYNAELFEKIDYKQYYQDNQHVPITIIDECNTPQIVPPKQIESPLNSFESSNSEEE
jgi:hypothetical protein